VVRVGPQHVRNGRIKIARAKGSDDVDIIMSPELAAAVEAMPKEHLTYLVNRYGKPRTVMGLGKAFPQWVAKAGLGPQCRLHGLKKSGMRRLAESGATTHELAATSGHRTLQMVQKYTEAVDRKKLADKAIRKRIANNQASNLDVPECLT
jgi:integrase